jgi:hypothetical protein
MLKKAMTAAAVLTVAGTLGVPAAHAAAASTIGPVTVAWTDSAHSKVRISWAETAPVANTISIAFDSLVEPVGSTAADGANELVVSPEALYPDYDMTVAKIVVEGAAGEKATSVGFDRYYPYGRTTGLSFTTSNAVQYSMAAPLDDTTPGDPLDVSVPAKWLPVLTLKQQPGTFDQCGEVTLPLSSTPTNSVASRNQPYALSVTAVNEWSAGRRGSYGGNVQTTAITMATALSGTVTTKAIFQTGMPPACYETSFPGANEPVILHARKNATSPWYVVGSMRTGNDGKFTFKVTPAGRQFRAVVVNSTFTGDGPTAKYGFTTAARS